jgi:hypothetical protein
MIAQQLHPRVRYICFPSRLRDRGQTTGNLAPFLPGRKEHSEMTGMAYVASVTAM